MRFAPRIVLGKLDLTSSPYGVEFGFNLDAPTTIRDVIASLMLDGSIATSTSHGNRENVRLNVIIDWPDSGIAVRSGEDLEVELAKPVNTLTFYPGDGMGPATVLETFDGHMEHDYDQDLEQTGQRRYILTIPALPFARSAKPVSFTWTGPGTQLSDLTSLAGWTAVPAPTPGDTGAGPFFEMSALTTLSIEILANNYVWIELQSQTDVDADSLHDVTVNDEPVDHDTIRFENVGGRYYTIPTEKWQGQDVRFEFQVNAFALSHTFLKEFWAIGYPNVGRKTSGGVSRPKGIDVLDVLGSARTGCTIRFVAPVGGAFVYTGPDPNAKLRRGAGEVVFGVFEVTDPAGAETDVAGYLQYFPEGEHQVNIGMTDPQPVELHPDGVFPVEEMAAFAAAGITGAFQYPYPSDTKAAISYFTTAGDKALVTPSHELTEGFHGDAVVSMIHSLHPRRSGFMVVDVDGDPITAEVEYYPRNLIYAAH